MNTLSNHITENLKVVEAREMVSIDQQAYNTSEKLLIDNIAGIEFAIEHGNTDIDTTLVSMTLKNLHDSIKKLEKIQKTLK